MSSKRTAIAGLFLGIACGLHMFVMTGLRTKYGIQNAGEILTAIGQDFGLSVKGTVFDPGYWYVTTQEAQWVGWVIQQAGLEQHGQHLLRPQQRHPEPALQPGRLDVAGAHRRRCRHGAPAQRVQVEEADLELAMWALIGGALMGIGSRLGLGCNVGAFFVRTANGDLSGWLFGLGMIGGAYVGVKFFNWWTERKMAKQMALAP